MDYYPMGFLVRLAQLAGFPRKRAEGIIERALKAHVNRLLADGVVVLPGQQEAA